MKATEHNGHHGSALHNQDATARYDALASRIDSPSAMEGLSEKYSIAQEPSLNSEERRAHIEALLPVPLTPCGSWPMDLVRSLIQTACRFS